MNYLNESPEKIVNNFFNEDIKTVNLSNLVSSDIEMIRKAEKATGGTLFGSFGGNKSNKSNDWYYILDIGSFDKNWTKDVKLKSGEVIYRYVTLNSSVGGIYPLVKVNASKKLAYFLTEESSSGELDKAVFETRGDKFKWIVKYDKE